LISSSRSPASRLFSYCAPLKNVLSLGAGLFRPRPTIYLPLIRITNVANPVKVNIIVQMATIHSVIVGFPLVFFHKVLSWLAGLVQGVFQGGQKAGG
jgi:hypothetical protein